MKVVPNLIEIAAPTAFDPVRLTVHGVQTTIANAVRLKTSRSGPTIVIFGGIHGNEWCGVEAVTRLVREFSEGLLVLPQGTVIFALGNEEALALNRRYVGENMNRQFHGAIPPKGSAYEQKRVEELKALLSSGVDYFLDLHSTSAPTLPYVMTEEARLEQARQIGFERIVVGWSSLADSSTTGDTETFASQHNACGFTMENGQHAAPLTIETAYSTARRFLSCLGVTPALEKPSVISQVYRLKAVQRLERLGFTYARSFSNLEPLQPHELIGRDSTREYRAPANHESVIVLPAPIEQLKVGENLYIIGCLE